MPPCELDHLVITAPDLAAGAEFVERLLGVRLEAGGEHPRMGTHNLLLRLGDSAFLEVIAPNPKAPKPSRSRWFELDRIESNRQPRLATWVVRTTDIRATLAACPEPLGKVEPMSRGDLTWLITLPEDGSLPLGGIAPILLQWQTGGLAAARLRHAGCSLVRLELFHPDAHRTTALLRSLSLEADVAIAKQPCLAAHIQTPSGIRKL